MRFVSKVRMCLYYVVFDYTLYVMDAFVGLLSLRQLDRRESQFALHRANKCEQNIYILCNAKCIAHLGYSECTPTSAMPASSLHVVDNASRLPAQGVFIELGIDSVDTGLRSYKRAGRKRRWISSICRLNIDCCK